MVFSDLLFIFVFLPFFALTYLLGGWIDRRRIISDPAVSRPMMWRNISLVIFSLLFYSWGEPVYILLMLLSVILNYVSGLLMDSRKSRGARKAWLVIGVALDIAILASFKYLGFFAEGLNQLGIAVDVPKIALPIGISFYIFQSISYLVDVYRKDTPVQKNFMDLLLYIAMFPQLIAGPIVRYGTVDEEIRYRTVTARDFSEGSYRFFIGLGKKVIIANIMGEMATRLLGGDLTHLSTAGAWVGVIAFSIQIYFDFSGYSDMAIGLGRSVGFHFPENFNHPYICTSMTDFWRRWHMSLGSFFRDYVYIPLGGNRRHQAVNILTVWILTGFWHGASWNFIIWGLYFGLIIMLEKYTLLRWKVWRPLLHIYSILLILIGWGMFYFDDIGRMSQFYAAFFGSGEGTGIPFDVESVINENLWLWILAIILCMPVRSLLVKAADRFALAHPAGGAHIVMLTRSIIAIVLLVLSVALLVGATNNAFIYTRF